MQLIGGFFFFPLLDGIVMELHEALEQIDVLMDMVTSLVAQGNPETTEQAMFQLREGVVAFNGLIRNFRPSSVTHENVLHMQRISDRLAQLREHIVKMGAITTQQLAALVPQQRSAHTYDGGKTQPGAAASVSRMYHVSG